MTTAKELNRALSGKIAEVLGTFFCRCCSASRPMEGSVKPPGRAPRRCASCIAQRAKGPVVRRPGGVR